MSPSTQARIRGYMEGFGEGKSAEEEWTLYPRGEPVTVKLFMSGVALDDGRTGVLMQGFVKEKAPDADLVRSIEALRHTSMMVTLLDDEGGILLQNPSAQQAFGPAAPFGARFEAEGTAEAIVLAASAGEVVTHEMSVKTLEGARWHVIEARRLVDPATGKTAILVQHTDETDRRGAEQRAEEKSRLVDELSEALDLVERQKQEILALSAPVLEVWAGTLALPIIGELDARRAAEIESRLLPMIAQRGADRVIVDLTGAVVQEAAAEHLTRLGAAIRLLGARTIVTGIPSPLARVLAQAGADLAGIVLRRNLREGIEAARKR
jgi:anti-anti-sigma regulatory factor